MFGFTNFPVLLCNGQFWQISMVPTLLVFHCTLIINPARLFHNFQNVQWFVHRWMICNYDVKRILTTLNDLYCVEWFTLRWIICTNLNNLYLQRWICFDYVEKFAQLLNDLGGSMKLPPGKYPPENCLGIFSPMKIPTVNIALLEKPLVEIPPVIIPLQETKNLHIFKI